MIVTAADSRMGAVAGVAGVEGVDSVDRADFLEPPLTLTIMARAGMAVWALALFKNVEPTLKVLLAGLGGRRPLYFS